MTDPQTIRIDVREVENRSGRKYYGWVLQVTGPVQDLAVSPNPFDTRAEAIADFERVAAILGWRTYIGVQGAAVIEEDEARAEGVPFGGEKGCRG